MGKKLFENYENYDGLLFKLKTCKLNFQFIYTTTLLQKTRKSIKKKSPNHEFLLDRCFTLVCRCLRKNVRFGKKFGKKFERVCVELYPELFAEFVKSSKGHKSVSERFDIMQYFILIQPN